ncbi:cytochrome c oxidase subunit I [soil metagenome]
MSTLDPTQDLARPSLDPAAATAPPAALRVLTTTDHKVVGTMFAGGSLLGLALVAALGVVLGAERVDGDGTLIDADVLSQLFAGYRVGLVFAVLAPLVLGLAVAVVPLQLGARSLALPRLAAAGFWGWLGGIVLVAVVLFNNGGNRGGNADMVALYLAAYGLMLCGLTAAATSVVVSVLTTRAPGMRLHRVPMFSWSALVGSLAMALTLPVAVGVTIFLYVDYRYDLGAFGGSTGISEWTSFLTTGPAVTLFAVMAVGFLAEVAAVTFRSRLPMRMIALAGVGLVGVSAFAGVAQQGLITLPGTGTAVTMSNWFRKFLILDVWAVLTLVPALGVLVVLGVVALTAKQAGRRPAITAPFVFAVPGVLLVLIGIFGSAVNGIEDLGLQGTVYEEGAAVAVVYGAVLVVLGAIVYWLPKLSGSLAPAGPLFGLAGVATLGAFLASQPYYIAGFADQPAEAAVFDYDGPSALWNLAVTAGHAMMLAAALAAVGLLAKSAFAGAGDAGDDPWGGQTLEWATTSPPPVDNFATTPTVMSPEPLLDLTAGPAPDGTDR